MDPLELRLSFLCSVSEIQYMIGTYWRNSFSVQSNECYTWKFSSHIILIMFIYSVSFLMLRAEMWLKALPYLSHSRGSFLGWLLRCQVRQNCLRYQTCQPLCTYLAQFHFYAFNKILSAFHIKMPHTSVVLGFSLACQDEVETNAPQL